jgi:hypothetical protein
MVHVGVWEDGQFIGAVLFSRGASQNLLRPYGLSQTEGCELTRVALRAHKAPVSRIVAIALKFLKKRAPALRLVVSFADPEEGHHGGIYQAMGWIYAGQNEGSVEYIGPDGKRWHSRMVNKKGWTTCYGVKRRVLTPSQCTPVRRVGKYRYLMPLDNEMRQRVEHLRKDYPKRAKVGLDECPSSVGGASPTRPLQTP